MKKRGKGPRRLGRILLPLLLLCAGAFYGYTQQNCIVTEEYAVNSPRLPEEFSGFRIAVVSDLHGKQFGKDNGALLEKLGQLHPDAIAVTGDLIDEASQLEALPGLAKGLAAIAPTYYVNGNHEWHCQCINAITDLLEGCGVTVLNDSYVTLTRGDGVLVIAGVQDPLSSAEYDKVLPTLMTEIYAGLGDPYVVLLAHRNTLYECYDAARVDVAVTGHGHGGLFRLPGVGGLIGNDRTLFPHYTAGVNALSFTQLVVSRGLGNEGGTFRLNNPPDLPVITLGR